MEINYLFCKHCKHKWIRRMEDTPKTCPRCKSYNWGNEPQIKYRRKG